MVKEILHVVSFSGGKDSTAMLFQLLERNQPVDRIVYVDMGKEFPAMVRHIQKVAKAIRPLVIDTLHVDFDYYFSRYEKKRGKNKGDHGYGWPGFGSRWCTRLKVHAIQNYLKQWDRPIVQYVGIAADEDKRASHAKKGGREYPLIEWGWTEQDCLSYCYSLGFDWEGLYTIFDRVSCFCCPLQAVGGLRKVFLNFPELWEEMREMDKLSRYKIHPRYSFRELEQKYQKELKEAGK